MDPERRRIVELFLMLLNRWKCCVSGGSCFPAPAVENLAKREMSLVDYASSSDDDVSDSEHEPPQQRHEPPALPIPQPPSPPQNQASGSSADQKPETFEKLPDASLLLNSPTVSLVSGSDHASVIAAAMAESASRKRESKRTIGLGSSGSEAAAPRAKLPRGTLPHSRSVPDTGGGLLVPPQLRGRSNVVTEDISKLFVSRHAVAQPRGPENHS